MIRIKQILCPLDFFPASLRAANFAIALARSYDAGLVLLHVVSPPTAPSYAFTVDSALLEAATRASEIELHKLSQRAESKGVSVKCLVRTGDIDLGIQSVIEEEKVDFVVMGTHGRRRFERWFMGSVTERLLRHVSVPLLTISAAGTQSEPRVIRRILLTTDFSEGTRDAVAYAFSIAKETHAKVTLLHVLRDVDANVSGRYREPLIRSIRRELEALIPDGSQNWCDVTVQVVTGLPFYRIPKILKREKIDLLVMNIHGKSRLERAMIGSTADRLVRTSPNPILLIPPLAAPAKSKQEKKGRKASA